jgi:hypothetical protein
VLQCGGVVLGRLLDLPSRVGASVLEKTDLISAIADQSDLSLAEAASAVEFVLLAMRPGRGPLKSARSSTGLEGTECADLPLLQVLQSDRINPPSAEK